MLPADANAVSIVSDGLVFEIDDTTKTATLVGSAATPPKGDLLVPASVTSGTTTYEVTAIAKNVFAKCSELTSVSLPATLREVDPDALMGCTSLKSITVSAKNETFVSHDGMLFTKDYSRLLLIPEGMEGAANIPGSTQFIPALALSRCRLMGSSLTAGDGSAAFTTLNGMLFTKDLKTLVSCPLAIGNAVVLPAETETIGEYALAGCKDLTSITALGNVSEINATVFAEEVKAAAVVALPAGESKAVWEQAGFEHFAEPAAPGATTRPEADVEDVSGLVYTLLDDYTLSVAWEGGEDPADEVEIPASAEINGVSYRVSTVAANAFANRGSLTNVKLPASITSIGEAAFAGCANLTTVSLPDSLQVINERAFEATELSNVWLPASVQSIGFRAFASCEALTRIVALNTSEVADDTLAGCANLSIYCPYNEAGSYPWNLGLIANNNHLMPYGLTLPEEPLYLEVDQSANLFEGAHHEVPEPCEVSYSYAAKPISVAPDGTVTAKAPGTSEVTATLTLNNQELARAARTVEVAAATRLAVEPSSQNTFSGEDSLFTPVGIQQISHVALLADNRWFEREVSSGQTLKFTVLDEVAKTVSVSMSADVAKRPSGDLVIPSLVTDETGETYTVTEIPKKGFLDLSNNLTLNSVILPETLNTIGAGALSWCNLTGTIRIPASVTSIDSNPFTGNPRVQAFVVDPQSTAFSSDESGALYNKDMTTLIAIPGGFKGHFDVPLTVTRIGSGMADTCSGLTSINLPAKLDTIKSQAFQNCGKLTKIELPEKVTYLSYGAFKGAGLTSIVLPASVKAVEGDALACKSLKEVLCLSSNLPTFSTGALNNRDPECVVYCPQAVAEKWQSTGASCVVFSTGAPSAFSVPDNQAVEMTVVPSIPATSEFPIEIRWENVDNTIATIESTGVNEAGACTFKVLPQVTNGSYVAQAKLMFTGSSTNVELARSDVNVSIVAPHGALPTENNASNTSESIAGWSLDENGVLTITSTESVANFKWEYSGQEMRTQHWGPLRDFVKSVDTTLLAGAKNMDYWFRDMINLSDISKAKLPDNVESLANTFAATGLISIPENFCIPESATNLQATFNVCKSLTTIPETFELPSKVESIGYLFGFNPNLTDLPESFRVPETVKNIEGFFREWTSLTAVPESFVSSNLDNVTDANCLFYGCSNLYDLPESFGGLRNATNLNDMFGGCVSLTKLPKGFSIPSATSCNYMFRDCSSLVTLPRDFKLPDTVKSAPALFANCTSLISLPDGFTVPDSVGSLNEMFAGCTSLLKLPDEFALPAAAKTNASIFRVEGTTLPMCYKGTDEDVIGYVWDQANRAFEDSNKPFPDSKTVTFNIKTKGEPGAGKIWYETHTDAAGMLAEPSIAPSRSDYVFTLWYADEECTRRADFSQPFAKDVTLYGVMAPGSLSGSMVTEAGTGAAFWSISDGTLYLRGAGMVTVMMPDVDDGTQTGKMWWPYRDQVRKIAMCPSLDALYTHNWFRGMTNLVDVREAFIPKSATILHRMFEGCNALTMLPEGFAIPDKVKNMASMFRGCTSLVSLPSTFFFSETSVINNVSYTFYDCSSLASLPERFSLPLSMGSSGLAGVFDACPSLTRLPDNFEMPEGAKNNHVFGWTVAQGEPRIATYYAGSNRSVLEYDWESQGRTLITDEAEMNGKGMQQAIFNMQVEQPDGTFAWETRSTAWSDKQGILADPGMPVHPDGYKFTGWCTDETCLTPFDFTKPLPERTTLYGKWVKHGGRGTAEGTLPVDDVGSAWWSITTDGAFNIKCEEGASINVNDFEWNDDCNKYWEPYANEVRSLNMHENVRARSVKGWFKNMTQLEDVRTGFFIPDNCVSALHLFYNDENLRYLPSGFFPENCKISNMWGMFQGCRSLESLPADFVLPESVTTIGCLFYDASSLTSLPEAFRLHKGITNMDEAFFMCFSLRSLPENLVIPESVISIASAFADCSKLTVLPSGLLSRLSESAKKQLNKPHANPNTDSVGTFGLRSSLAVNPLPTYFPAPKEQQDLITWSAQRRKLVTDPAAEGQALVKLMVPNADGADFYSWQTLMVAQGESLNQPPAPARAGGSFVGWYNQSDYQTQVTFPLVVSSETTLYAKYINNSGALPTVDVPGNNDPNVAGWSLSSDGTLSITCAEGQVIKEFDWASPFVEKYWGPVRGKVKRVEMAPSIKTESMLGWFYGMTNLEDATGVFVPEGCRSTSQMFSKCAQLRELSAEFFLPEGLIDATSMFYGCSSLVSLPVEFALPKTLENSASLFGECSSLVSLPACFDIPSGLKNCAGMFVNCKKLKSIPTGVILPEGVESAGALFYGMESLRALPAGFSIPESATDVKSMFQDCRSLESLPAGFRIPDTVVAKNFDLMFAGCNSLRALPEGFTLPSSGTSFTQMFLNCFELTSLPGSLDLSTLSSAASKQKMFFVSEDPYKENPLVTYYTGDSSAKLLPPKASASDAATYWLGFNRKLVWNGAGSEALPKGTYRVTFNVQKPDATQPSEWMTVLATAGEDGITRVAKPEEPSEFGYVFDGWYTDASFAAESKFSFGTAEVTDGLKLYGRYTLRLSYDIPVAAKVTVDSSGNVEADAIQMKSFTPKPLMVSSVSVVEAPGAEKLFPNSSERSQVQVVIGFGSDSYRLVLGQSRNIPLGEIPIAKPAEPGVLDGQLSIDRKEAQINFQPGEDITSFAKLTWTISPAA